MSLETVRCFSRNPILGETPQERVRNETHGELPWKIRHRKSLRTCRLLIQILGFLIFCVAITLVIVPLPDLTRVASALFAMAGIVICILPCLWHVINSGGVEWCLYVGNGNRNQNQSSRISQGQGHNSSGPLPPSYTSTNRM